ncbi:hypothetical protein Tco_0982077, partial [Tanacetum coccineum]
MMANTVFEVNANLLPKAIQVTPKDPDHPFVAHASEREIISFINELGYPGVEIDVERVSIPKRRCSKTMIKETSQLGGVEDEADSEETEEEYEILLVHKQTGVIISRKVHQESIEDALDHSKKLKGVERMYETAKFLAQLKQAEKARKQDFILQQRPRGSGEGSGVTPEVPDGLNKKGPNEGSSVTPVVPDEPSDSSSNLSLDFKEAVEDKSSDKAGDTEKVDDEKKADNEKSDDVKKADTEKADDVKKAYIGKDTKEQGVEEHVVEEYTRKEEQGDDKGGNEQAGDTQAGVHMSEPLIEKPKATLISSTQTLSSVEFMNQVLNDNPDVTIHYILKDPIEPEVQSMVDVLVTQEKLAELRPRRVVITVTLIHDTTTVSPTQPPQTQPKRRKICNIPYVQ